MRETRVDRRRGSQLDPGAFWKGFVLGLLLGGVLATALLYGLP